MKKHFRGKPHKRRYACLREMGGAFHVPPFRLQALKEPAYSQKEAEMAAGMGNYILKAPSVAVTDICMGDTASVNSP